MDQRVANGWTPPRSTDPALDAVIVGAGFSGLYQLHQLRDRLGLAVRVLETGSDVGGTWYWNRYPGARCDSESHYYCYSFSPDLEQDWSWSERYPGQEEGRGYLEYVPDRFDLRRDIRFRTRVTSAEYSPDDDWTVHTRDVGTGVTARWRARFVVTAVGCLSAANVPTI